MVLISDAKQAMSEVKVVWLKPWTNLTNDYSYVIQNYSFKQGMQSTRKSVQSTNADTRLFGHVKGNTISISIHLPQTNCLSCWCQQFVQQGILLCPRDLLQPPRGGDFSDGGILKCNLNMVHHGMGR